MQLTESNYLDLATGLDSGVEFKKMGDDPTATTTLSDGVKLDVFVTDRPDLCDPDFIGSVKEVSVWMEGDKFGGSPMGEDTFGGYGLELGYEEKVMKFIEKCVAEYYDIAQEPKSLSELTQPQKLERASNKVEAALFYAFKKKEELELKLEGVIASKLDTQQIAESIESQNREIDVYLALESLVQNELDILSKEVISETII